MISVMVRLDGELEGMFELVRLPRESAVDTFRRLLRAAASAQEAERVALETQPRLLVRYRKPPLLPTWVTQSLPVAAAVEVGERMSRRGYEVELNEV